MLLLIHREIMVYCLARFVQIKNNLAGTLVVSLAGTDADELWSSYELERNDRLTIKFGLPVAGTLNCRKRKIRVLR